MTTSPPAPERLAALLRETPGAGPAALRALAGWACPSTIESVLACRAVIELKARGVARGLPPAGRLDVLAALLALSHEAQGNAREMALNAAALVATALHEARDPADDGARRAAVAGDYVLSVILPEPAAVGPTGAPTTWTPGLRCGGLFQGPLAPGRAWTCDDPDQPGRYLRGRARDAEVARQVLAAVREDRAPRLALSPAPAVSDELLGNVASSVARDADYLAASPPLEAAPVGAPAARVATAPEAARREGAAEKANRIRGYLGQHPDAMGVGDTDLARAVGIPRPTLVRLLHVRPELAGVQALRERTRRADQSAAPSTRRGSRDGADLEELGRFDDRPRRGR